MGWRGLARVSAVEYEIGRRWARSELCLEALLNFDILRGGQVERRIGLARKERARVRGAAKTNPTEQDTEEKEGVGEEHVKDNYSRLLKL